MTPTDDTFLAALAELLSGYPPAIGRQARALMRAVERAQPALGRKVNRGWRAVAYRHPRAGYVCGVFPRADRVMLLFEHGRLLSDPAGVLEGDGRQVRFIPFAPGDKINRILVADYLNEALALRM